MAELIYVKLEHSEAIQAKKDILSSEARLLNIAQIMKRYQPLRDEELKAKIRVHTKISEVIKNIKKLETVLPKVKLPKIIKESHEDFEDELDEKLSQTKIRNYDSNLSSQLQEIQDKLKELAYS